jgi:hypothetical protein
VANSAVVTVSQFRTDYTEFADDAAFPDPQIQFWINAAGLLLNPLVWNELLVLGTELFVAHNISLEYRAQQEASVGGQPGVSTGPVSAKAVKSVSTSFDSQAAIVENGGDYNLTIYGTRYLRIARQVGMGPLTPGVQIGPTFTQAFVGPEVGPAW